MELGGWRPQGEITVFDSDALRRVPRNEQDGLRHLINELGEASARAQRLPSVITTYEKLFTSSNQRLYLFAQGGLGVGFVKMGVKKLFVRTETGRTVEMDPLCCLDFYVHESQQRRGTGKKIFEFMLCEEHVEPRKLAYDRPSPKLIGFMQKHFRLSSFVSQPNHYVVFDQYFDDRPPSSRADRSVSSRPLSSTKRRRGGGGGREEVATSLGGLGGLGGLGLGQNGNGLNRPPRGGIHGNNVSASTGTGGGSSWGGGLAPIRGPGAIGAPGGLPFEHISMAEQNRVPRVPKLAPGRERDGRMEKALRNVRGGGGGGMHSGADARNNEADFTRQLREQQMMSETDRQVMGGGRDGLGNGRGQALPGIQQPRGGGGRRDQGFQHPPQPQGQQRVRPVTLLLSELPTHVRPLSPVLGANHRRLSSQPSFLDRIEQQANATMRSLNDPNHFTPDAPLRRQRSEPLPPSSSRSLGPPGPMGDFGGPPPGGGFGRPSYSQPAGPPAARVRGVQGTFLSTSLW